MIDKDEIYNTMNSLGFNITEREAEAMIDVADLDRGIWTDHWILLMKFYLL